MNFDILDQFGKKINCNVVSLFSNEENKRNYVIYTDGTKNSDGKLEIYASRYKQNPNGSIILEEIEDDEEWDLVDMHLANMR